MRIAFQQAAFALVAAMMLTSGIAQAESTSRSDVRSSLGEMHHWVGTGENGERWRAYLMSGVLEGELAKGDLADRQAVAEVLQQYESDANGLGMSRFVAVRDALKRWLADLPVDENQLVDMARNAKPQFAAVTDQQVANAKAELQAAVAELEQFLSRGTQANLDRWKQYLRWSSMEEQLNSDQPRLNTLDDVHRLYMTNVTGVEGRRFVRVREALDRYLDLAQLNDPRWQNYSLREIFAGEHEKHQALLEANTQELQHETLIDTLADTMANYADSRSGDAAWQIGRLTGILDRANRAESLVESIRKRYWHPNLYAQVSERLIAAGIENDELTEVTPVHDNILGTSIHGTATLHGQLKMDLVPSDDSGRFNIVLAGAANSDTVGYNRNVRIFTTGLSQVNASAQVIIDANGLRSTSAIASVCTSTTINCIAARLRLVENIAWKQAGKQKGTAEQIASRKAEVRAASRMDEQAAEMLADANKQFEEKVRVPLNRMGAFPRLLNMRSSDDYLFIRAMSVNRDQLAAPDAPPEIADPRDLAARVHETLVSNFSESTRAGRRLTGHDVEKMYIEANREVPENLKMSGTNKQLWSFRFAKDRPVRAAFVDGQVKVALHAYEIVLWEGDIDHPELYYTEPMPGYPQPNDETRIAATYSIESNESGVRFVRNGDVEAESIVPLQGIAARRRAGISVLKSAFEGVFKPEFEPEDIQLPGEWEKAGRLRLQSADSRNGWLLLTWSLLPNEVTKTARARATDARK